MDERLTGQTVELLQQLIRNQCVNDGTLASGQEIRTTDVLRAYLQGSGLDFEVYQPDAAPGRASLVARIEGSDPKAPTLCLMPENAMPRTVPRRSANQREISVPLGTQLTAQSPTAASTPTIR